MSTQYAWPSSLRLELEAQRLHRRSGETALGGAALEETAAPLVLAGATIAVLPLALSPVGAALGRFVSGRYGRGVGLTGGQFILGAATTAMAFLPTHAQAGWFALALLLACRTVQGLAAGAAWGDEPGRSGGWDLTVLSATLGLMAAGGLMLVLVRVLSPADFADWGWRYPFAIGFVINIVGLFANLRVLAIPKARAGGEGSRLVDIGR